MAPPSAVSTGSFACRGEVIGIPAWWVYDANHTTDDLPQSAMAHLKRACDTPPPDSCTGAACLRELAETLASVSLWHLCPATRELLSSNALSVNAYPTEFGGLVFVGSPRQRIPVESDLNRVTELAERDGIAWLLFDIDAPVIDSLPVFDPAKSDH